MEMLEKFGSTLTIKDRVYAALKREIILGRLKPGETLNILTLSEKMNISCAPIREAMNMLSKDGLVELQPHKRPVVASGSVEDYQLSVDLRKMLEPYAAKMSADRIPLERIYEVKRQLEDVLDSPENVLAYVESDMALHELLHVHYHSRLLSDTLSNIKSYTMRFRYLAEKVVDESDQEAAKAAVTVSTREHLDVIDALLSRDPERICAAVQAHIQNYSERNKSL